jgi:hypothetical protein
MLGMDAARNRYWAAFGGSPGLTFLLGTFSQELRESGLTDTDLKTIFIDNPARAYALSPVVKEMQAHSTWQSQSSIASDKREDSENIGLTSRVISK